MIDEGLVDTTSATWSDRWKSRVGTGTIASVFSGAWMPSLLLSNVPGAAGLWRVAPMPTYDGQPTNAESGGSALTVLQLTRKRMRLIVSWTLWRMTPKALARVWMAVLSRPIMPP